MCDKYFNEDSGNVVFSCNEMGILNIDLNFDEDDPDTSIHIRLLAWHIKFEKRKERKKQDKWRINSNSVASPKKVEFLHVRRSEKRYRTGF